MNLLKSMVLCNIPYQVSFNGDLPAARPNAKPEDCSLFALDGSLFHTFAANGMYKIMFHTTIYRRSPKD